MAVEEALIKNQIQSKIGSLLGANILKKTPDFSDILVSKSDKLIDKAREYWFEPH